MQGDDGGWLSVPVCDGGSGGGEDKSKRQGGKTLRMLRRGRGG